MSVKKMQQTFEWFQMKLQLAISEICLLVADIFLTKTRHPVHNHVLLLIFMHHRIHVHCG